MTVKSLTIPPPKEHSRSLSCGRDDLESKLSRLFSQSEFGALSSLFITFMKDGLRTGFLGSHDVVEDSRDFVGSGSNGLRRSEFGSHTPEELAEIVFCPAK